MKPLKLSIDQEQKAELPVNLRGALREIPVKISGTYYIPIADPIVIESTFGQILEQQYGYQIHLQEQSFCTVI